MPHAVRPGEPVDLVLYGGALEGTTGLWNSFGAAVELTPGVENNGQRGDQVSFRFTAPADTPTGIGGIRVSTLRGVSEVRLVMIDRLASVGDNGANKSRESAQALSLPTAVDGACEAESFDYYSFSALPGQHVAIEVVAQRLGSPLDPVVRLLDAAGNELAYSDDEPGLGADCRLAYEFTAEGTYFVELRDIRYQGSGGHRYRLRLGDFPLTTTGFPLGVQRATTAHVDPIGPNVGEGNVVLVAAPANARVVHASAGASEGGTAGLVLAVGDLPEAVEFEPNDEPAAASPLSLPSAIDGRFAAVKDRDFFQFTVAAGQRWTFTGQTRTLGSPSDLYLRLYKEDGTLLAEADDSGTAEGILDYTFAEAGNYRLMVEDLHRRGGPEHAYRVVAEPYRAGFSLVVETDRLNAPQGGVLVAKVTTARRDYNGPISLSLEGAGEGVVLSSNVIAENANETVLRATLPSTLEPGQMRSVRIVGRATIGEATFEAVASNAVALKGLLAGLPNPPLELDGQLALGVGPKFGDFFKLVAEPVVAYPQLVGTQSFIVKIEKQGGFDDAVALAVEGLPAGYTAEAKPIEKGKGEAEVILKGPLTPAEVDVPLSIVGTSTFQEQPGRVVLPVTLRVIRPLGVSLSAAGPLKTGSSVKVKIAATRFAGSTAPVQIAWRGLPSGISAPENVVLAEGQNEIEIDLSAAADAALGAGSVRVVATSVVAGRTVNVESAPLALEVTMP